MDTEYTQRLEKIEAVLRDALPDSFGTEWMELSFSRLPGAVKPEHVAPLETPCRDLLLRGGKRWRPLLMVLAGELAGGETDCCALVPVVEFVHTASLIHDDIEDGADRRRGAPAVHIAYGTDTAVNSGTWLFFEAAVCLERFPCSVELKQSLYRTFMEEVRRLHLGQAMDITWHRDNTSVPSRAEYEAMVRLKTGTLASLAARTGILCGGGTEEQALSFGELAADAGVGFQVLDDVLNLTDGNPGKKRGDDIVEGKKSLPVLIHMERCPGDLPVLMSCFTRARAEGIGSDAVEECIALLNGSGSVAAAREYGTRLIESVCSRLESGCPASKPAALLSGLFKAMLK